MHFDFICYLDFGIWRILISQNFLKITPLKIRGARPARRTNSLAGGGVMIITEITPFIPLTLRGRLKESPYFKGEIEGKRQF